MYKQLLDCYIHTYKCMCIHLYTNISSL